jgi:hypothetical protein
MHLDDRSIVRMFGVFLAAFAGACEPVEGGAVELSWKFRPATGGVEDKFVGCTSGRPGTGPITAIRLVWQTSSLATQLPSDVVVHDHRGGRDAIIRDHDEWPCDDSHGVTGFALPPGTTNFAVVPICATGPADPASYIAPAIAQRNVILGDTVSLGAVELVVHVAQCDRHPCICE